MKKLAFMLPLFLGASVLSSPVMSNDVHAKHAIDGCSPPIIKTNEPLDYLPSFSDFENEVLASPSLPVTQFIHPYLRDHQLSDIDFKVITDAPLFDLTGILFGKGEGHNINIVFSDPHCPHCKTLYDTLNRADDNAFSVQWMPVGVLSGRKGLEAAGSLLIEGRAGLDESTLLIKTHDALNTKVSMLKAAINTSIFVDIVRRIPDLTLSTPMMLTLFEDSDGSLQASFVSGSDRVADVILNNGE